MLRHRVHCLLCILPLTACGARHTAGQAVTSSEADAVSSGVDPASVLAPPFDTAFANLCYEDGSVEIERAGSRHFVPVTIRDARGSVRTFRFHVDTGGSTRGVNLNLSAARQLGYVSAEEFPRTIRVGPREVQLQADTQWLLLDDSAGDPQRKSFSVGQLGAGFLSRYTVCFDASRSRLGFLSPDDVREPENLPWIPIALVSGGSNHASYPFVFVRVGGGSYGMLLDTGATTSMITTSPLAWLLEENPGWPTTRGAAGDVDMIGSAFIERVVRVRDLSLGANDAQNRVASLASAASVRVASALFVERPNGVFEQMFGVPPRLGSSEGAIGNEVLDRFRFVIDYRRQRLYIEPTSGLASDGTSMSRVGLSLSFPTSDGCPVIRAITETNDASVREAVRVGDVLLAVDGLDACRAFHHEISTALSGRVGETKRLRLHRAGTDIVVDGRLAELL